MSSIFKWRLEATNKEMYAKTKDFTISTDVIVFFNLDCAWDYIGKRLKYVHGAYIGEDAEKYYLLRRMF